jgi:hypothetical protein
MSFCNGAIVSMINVGNVTPGEQIQFTFHLLISGSWDTQTYHSIWQFSYETDSPTWVPFAPNIELTITNTIAVPVDN